MIEINYTNKGFNCCRISYRAQRVNCFLGNHRDSGRRLLLRTSSRAEPMKPVRATQEVEAGELLGPGALSQLRTWVFVRASRMCGRL